MTHIMKMILLVSAQLYCLALFILSGAMIIESLTAISVDQARLKYGIDFPSDWNGVAVSHGNFLESKMGPASDNPLMLTIMAMSCALCWFIVVCPFVYLKIKKFQAAQQGDAPEPATNADPASRPPTAPAR